MSQCVLGCNMRNRVVTGQRGVKIVDFYDSQLYMGLAMSAIMECNGSVLGSGRCNGPVMGARNPRLSEWHRTQHQCTIVHTGPLLKCDQSQAGATVNLVQCRTGEEVIKPPAVVRTQT